jgi:hypothetical protein
MKLEEGRRPPGRLTPIREASGFVWSNTSESRRAYVAACLQVSVRKLNGRGGTELMKLEGCTERTDP